MAGESKFTIPDLDRVARLAIRPKVAPPTHLAVAGEESLFVMCEKCKVQMEKLSEYTMSCPKCTVSMDIGNTGEYTIGTGEQYGCSSNAYTSFRPTGGVKCQIYLHAMVKATSDGDAQRDSRVLAAIKHCNECNTEFKLPYDVLQAAQKLFLELKDHDYVSRGMARRGKLGACLFVACQQANIAKTQAQIAHMMGVDESKISFGLAELQKYHDRGIIVIPQNRDPTPDYLNSLFEMFDIKIEYKQFALDLLDRAVKKRIDGIAGCFMMSRCIGVLWGLNMWVNLGITHEMITHKCDKISRNTYLNVYRVIEANEVLLRKSFTKHKIPVPRTWPRSPLL